MTNNYRYPGSRPFEQKDASLFFGRNKETEELYNLVNVEKIVSVFARSGIGKTSLIQAGLLPKLEATAFYPIFIRFNDLTQSPLAQFRQQYSKAISAQLSEEVTIWEAVKQHPIYKAGKPAQPLLILDQFEELFTLYGPQNRKSFIDEFADLANGRIPDSVQQHIRHAILNDDDIPDSELAEMERPPLVSIIIAIRSDFLHLLDEVSKQIPNILRTRVQLAPLKQEQAKDAILRPAALQNAEYECPAFEFETQAIQDILTHLQNNRQEIESFQLQILCRYIEEKRIKEQTQKPVHTAFYGGQQGIQSVLNNFYNNKIAELPAPQQPLARKMIEEGLITESERRRSAEENDLIKQYSLDIKTLNRLVESRLLRKEPRLDSYYYEISHDTLVQPILISYKSRKATEEAAQQAAELARLKAEQEKQAAALAEEKRRADEQAELRRKAEQAQKRATLFAWGAGVLALIAVIVGIWAWQKSQEAEEQTKVAIEEKNKAKLADSVAQISAKVALHSDSIAQQKAKEALRSDSLAQQKAKEATVSNLTAQQKAKEALRSDSISQENLRNFHQAQYESMKKKIAAYRSINEEAAAQQQEKAVLIYKQQYKQYLKE